MRVFPGTIDRDTLSVPDTPDITHEIVGDRGGETLIITLTPPGEGRVRTGVIANVEVTFTPDLPGAISAQATDVSGNRAVLPSFDVRGRTDAVICFNE